VTAARAIGPLLALAGVVAGILVGEHLGPAPARLTLVCGVAVAVSAWIVDGWTRRVVVVLAVLLLGCAVMQRALDGLESGARALAGGGEVDVRGQLVGDPDGPRFGASALVRLASPDRIVLVKASGDDAGRLRVLQAGDRVDLRGRFEPLPRHGYDARYRWQHASALFTDTSVIGFQPARGVVPRLANDVRAAILRGTTTLAPTPRAVTAGFLLGDTRAIPDDVTADYRDSGLSHLLAVSGANVAFVLLVFAPLLRRLSLLPRTAGALAIVCSFAAATRFEPSVLRASALTTVTILATFVGRPVAPVRALAIAVLGLLLIDPFLVHSVGFLLSCGAAAGIALLSRPLAQRLSGPRIVREQLAVSIAAQAGVTPVLLATFGSVPALTPVANLLAAPAAEALGVFGLAAGVVGGVAPPLGRVTAPLIEALVAWVTAVAHGCASAGGEIRTPQALVIVAIVSIAMVARRARRSVPDAASR